MSEKALRYLNTLSDPILNIIDVGCHAAHFRQTMGPHITKQSFWIGIDPLDKGVAPLYNVYLQKAIADVNEETYMDFYEYEYGSCSSLLKMTNNVTHDLTEYNNKWYAPFVFEKLKQIIQVPVCSLKNVIQSIPQLLEGNLHYVLIDAQGMDIKVVDSLHEFINKTYFIQIETVISKNKNITLYEGQTHSEYDIKHMEDLGFGIYDRIDYTESPEADIIFYNKTLVGKDE